jgi:hypothetical protein
MFIVCFEERDAKYLRLSCLDHVERMESERNPKCLLSGEPFGVHRIGREGRGTKYMAANCEGSQRPPRAVELRKKKKNGTLLPSASH